MALDNGFEEHGSLNYAELRRLGIDPRKVIDFSVNSNPFGPTESVSRALRSVDPSVYPDRGCVELCARLAEANGISTDHILVGNRTAELIWLVCQAFLKMGDRVLIPGPTFGEYRRAASALDVAITEVRATPPEFLPTLEELVANIKRERPRLVFICNPNNPTGKYLGPEAIAKILEACGSDTTLVVDEAYRAFLDGRFFAGLPSDNCLVLRSMTKDFALAGLRLGYVLTRPEWIERLRRFQPAWSVNAFAQSAGLAALADVEAYRKNLYELSELKRNLFFQIEAAGNEIVPSDVHFGLVHAGGPAGVLRSFLLREYVQVRDCASFGLPDYIRVSTRRTEENQQFIAVLKAIHH